MAKKKRQVIEKEPRQNVSDETRILMQANIFGGLLARAPSADVKILIERSKKLSEKLING